MCSCFNFLVMYFLKKICLISKVIFNYLVLFYFIIKSKFDKYLLSELFALYHTGQEKERKQAKS